LRRTSRILMTHGVT